jgi:hypothetical protein
MDQWNWKKEEAILRLGITMACGGVLVKNIHSLRFYDVLRVILDHSEAKNI